MTATMWLLVVVAYAALAYALVVPASAWVAADRDRWSWVGFLAIPVINVLGFALFVVGVLPLLIREHPRASRHPFRRGGPGGSATRTSAGRMPLTGRPVVPEPPRPTRPIPLSDGAAGPDVATAHGPAPAAMPWVPPVAAHWGVVPSPWAAHGATHLTAAPASAPGARWSPERIAALAVTVMVVAATVTWFVLPRSSDTSPNVVTAGAGPSPVTASAGDTDGDDAAFPVTTPTPEAGAWSTEAGPVTSWAPASGMSAGDLLRSRVQGDAAGVESLVGRWVPQIGSKAVGTVDNGTVYDDNAIWNDVVAAGQRYPGALLLRSDDYSSFRRGGFWVLVQSTPFDSATQANAWCDAAGLPATDCFAKRLSHTEGPTGNSLPR